MLELGLALGLAVFSVAFLAGVVLLALYHFGPITSSSEGSGGGRAIILGSFGLAAYVLKYPWAALLKYYRYEAQTLRPIKDETTAMPRDGGGKHEG